MTTTIHNTEDRGVTGFKSALDAYERTHPNASASLYRYEPDMIRIRIVDPRFETMTRPDRHYEIWDFLAERAGDELMGEIGMLLPIAPSECEQSFANRAYEAAEDLDV